MLWHNFFTHLPRLTRYTLGSKSDNLFIEILGLTLSAKYTKHDDKLLLLEGLGRKLDQLKFFITLLWETKALDTNKYSQLSGKLVTAGRMLGKWIENAKDKNAHL